MDMVYTVLLSWAAWYSGYPLSEQLPEVQFQPHEWFVEMACKGKSCKVEGWYSDKGVVYIDEKYRQLDGFGSSLVVHEFVHHLQYVSGDFMKGTCIEFIEKEIEAYLVQNMYLTENTTTLRYAGYTNLGCKIGALE